MKQTGEIQMVSNISYRVESTSEVQIKYLHGVEELVVVIINFESVGIEQCGLLVAAPDEGDFLFKP